MNPILVSVLQSVLGSRRKCPKCGKTQIVSLKKRSQAVSCKGCGAPMPPKSTEQA